MKTILAGDIGGTKTILRLVEIEETNLRGKIPALAVKFEQTYASQAYSDLVPMVEEFLKSTQIKIKVDRACFGIAGPVINNTSQLTNLSWDLNNYHLEQKLNIKQVKLINDFEAIGYGVLGLKSEDLYSLQPMPVNPEAPIAVIGAGTGLGEGFLTPIGDGTYRVFGSEGSHADFPARNNLEIQLHNYVQQKYNIKRVSVERVVSGQGIITIYQFLRDQNPQQESLELKQIYENWESEQDKDTQTLDLAAEISIAAQNKTDSLCCQTMKIFMEAYGAEAGNLAIKLLPYGGLYIAGGIVTKNISLLKEGDFLEAFHNKGRLTPLMKKIPVYAVLNPKVGLIGASLCAAQMQEN